jgi:hypothetical protein
MSNSQAAELVGVTPQAVRNWLKAHAKGGTSALAARKRGRRQGEKRRLSADQAVVIAELVRDRCPDQLKLPFYLWTRAAVAVPDPTRWRFLSSRARPDPIPFARRGRCPSRWRQTCKAPGFSFAREDDGRARGPGSRPMQHA